MNMNLSICQYRNRGQFQGSQLQMVNLKSVEQAFEPVARNFIRCRIIRERNDV